MKKSLLAVRVYDADKKLFQRICSDLRIASEGKITEADVFREMLDWLKKNREFVELRLTKVRG